MNVVPATTAYERWAGARIDLVAADLRRKHQAMASAAFPFLRATFYRWCALWHEACPDLATAPRLLAVGDLHIENFGTWRDSEGRLCWGINDFDEACAMPYAIDLVRLAASALLATRGSALAIDADESCRAILDGYRQAIDGGVGAAAGFVLEEAHPGLRAMALGEERDPIRFWAKLKRLRPVEAPRAVRKLLARQWPDRHARLTIAHRVAGLGSLGRPRYVALGTWQDGLIAREAKAMLPSSYGWATAAKVDHFHLTEIVRRAIRSPDPFYIARKGWVLRRLAPHCTRIEMSDYPARRAERRLLHAMGREIANVHFGSPDAIAAVRRDLKRRGRQWLHVAAQRMADATLADGEAWRALR